MTQIKYCDRIFCIIVPGDRDEGSHKWNLIDTKVIYLFFFLQIHSFALLSFYILTHLLFNHSWNIHDHVNRKKTRTIARDDSLLWIFNGYKIHVRYTKKKNFSSSFHHHYNHHHHWILLWNRGISWMPLFKIIFIVYLDTTTTTTTTTGFFFFWRD